MSEKLKSLVPKLSGQKILVLGDLMLDTYLQGDASRISPEAPVPVVKLNKREDRPGGAANCAMNIAAMGGIPVLVGTIGNDEAGEIFRKLIRGSGFDDSGIISDSSITTIRKTRVVASTQQIVRVDEEKVSPLIESLIDKAFGFISDHISDAGAVAVSDYAKGFIGPELMTVLHDISRQNRVPILVDPKPSNIGIYSGSDLIKPNRKEISEITGFSVTDEKSCDDAANLVKENYSPKSLLVTLGQDGMRLYANGKDPVNIRAKVSRIFDVSGAGDTVLAVCALGYASGMDTVDSCTLASYAAAVAVTKPGTSVVTPEELIVSIDME
ncbi:MAG TPA: PfkB family carbohydrate kinase [bacterium]|jgi:rfaE bifunctional protein kinase chain/domain